MSNSGEFLNIKNSNYNALTGVLRYETLDGELVKRNVSINQINRLIEIGMDITINNNPNSLRYKLVRSFMKHMVSGFLPLTLNLLVEQGVGLDTAIKVAVLNMNYIDDELVDKINKVYDAFEKKFPDIPYNKSNVNAFVIEKELSDEIKKEPDMSGFTINNFSRGFSSVFVRSDQSWALLHEVFHNMSLHDRCDGFQINDPSGIQRRFAIDEGMTEFMVSLFDGEQNIEYPEYNYLKLLSTFIEEKDLVKIYMNGTLEDLDVLLFNHGDTDRTLINLMDKDHRRCTNQVGINKKIADMFLYTMKSQEIDVNTPAGQEKVNTFLSEMTRLSDLNLSYDCSTISSYVCSELNFDYSYIGEQVNKK